MKVSRRNFVQIFGGTAAIVMLPELFADDTTLVDLPEYDLEEVQIETLYPKTKRDGNEIPLELGEFPTQWVTTGNILRGPCRVYDIMACDLKGKFRMRREYRRADEDPILMDFMLNKDSTFRWCAAPGEEIIVPKGDCIYIQTPEITNPIDQAFWMHFDRPGSNGKYREEYDYSDLGYEGRDRR